MGNVGLSDFESEIKDPREITLAVVWEDDFHPYRFPTYMKQPLEDSVLADQHFARVTQVIHDSGTGTRFQVLVLSDAVDEILNGS